MSTATAQSLAKNRSRFSNLRRFNAVIGVFHLIQGIAMLAISSDFSLPVNTSFLAAVGEGDTVQLVSQTETLFDLRIGPVVASFLLMSAIAHFLVASPTLFPWYRRNLEKGVNYARWIEYSISSSTMIVVIAMLFGIYDVANLLLIFALNAMMILFGWMMELHNQTTDKTDWTSFYFGSIAGIVPWIAIGIYLIGSGLQNGNVPNFVYAIYASLFVFFNVFAINMVVQYKKIGPWKDYLYGERAYIILSLVAKSLLAWQVYAGTLQPA